MKQDLVILKPERESRQRKSQSWMNKRFKGVRQQNKYLATDEVEDWEELNSNNQWKEKKQVMEKWNRTMGKKRTWPLKKINWLRTVAVDWWEWTGTLTIERYD